MTTRRGRYVDVFLCRRRSHDARESRRTRYLDLVAPGQKRRKSRLATPTFIRNLLRVALKMWVFVVEGAGHLYAKQVYRRGRSAWIG